MMERPMQKMDGMNYAPVFQGEAVRVVSPGMFCFSVVGLDHGHVFAMVNGLLEAGATIRYVHDSDQGKVQDFLRRYPEAKPVDSEEPVLSDALTSLVVSAIRPDLRAGLGLRVLASGKDYFVDKPGMLTFDELEAVKTACEVTGRKYVVYYGERIHVEGAVFVERLIRAGRLGRVVDVTIIAPHRLNKESRPWWFFDPLRNGGILTDIGSHQIEQFLSYVGATTARVLHSTVANFANPDYPRFCDFGDVSLLADNGAVGYIRVDWFTPDGLSAWGDGRVFIVGTKATVEIRKYVDIANDRQGDQVYLVDGTGEHRYSVSGKVGFPFFGALVLDCINRTETAISQRHVFEAMRLTLQAQKDALRIGS